MNSYWESTFMYSYNQQLGDIFDYMSGYAQYDYLNYRRKSGVLSERKSHLTSLKFNYKNVLQAFFFNSSFTYIKANKNLLNKMEFNNNAILNTNIQQDNNSSNWLLYGYLGKYLSSISSNFSLSVNLSLSESQKIQQKERYPINSTNWNLIANWTTQFSDALNMTYNGSLNYNILHIDSEDGVNKNKNHQLSQRLSCYYLVSTHWAFNPYCSKYIVKY